MFISVLDLFKVGIGPSSSHTMGPMVAANAFLNDVRHFVDANPSENGYHVRCTLKDSLAYTGVGHATDRAVVLGLNGYLPNTIIDENMDEVIDRTWNSKTIAITEDINATFFSEEDIVFDTRNSLKQHPNGIVFELLDKSNSLLISNTYFSIGGGFISTLAEIDNVEAPIAAEPSSAYPFPFDNSDQMLEMSKEHNKTIWEMKQANELENIPEKILNQELDKIWNAMKTCVERGLTTQRVQLFLLCDCALFLFQEDNSQAFHNPRKEPFLHLHQHASYGKELFLFHFLQTLDFVSKKQYYIRLSLFS